MLGGRLQLRFDRDRAGGRTVLAACEQQPPLRVVRAFPTADGGALVHLHNLSGGVLGGDQLRLSVRVGPGSAAQITSTGATRVYRSRQGSPVSVQSTAMVVEEEGLLEYLPDPLIPFAGSRYRQETRIDLAHGAGLFWWETIAPGREARGEIFEY
ncbi:MAG: urease accessory protein UreD, partial [Candidatus Solibacter usitatus]|nr:urease accessory protein UreD [Candidatus Solibacter usitatus]